MSALIRPWREQNAILNISFLHKLCFCTDVKQYLLEPKNNYIMKHSVSLPLLTQALVPLSLDNASNGYKRELLSFSVCVSADFTSGTKRLISTESELLLFFYLT